MSGKRQGHHSKSIEERQHYWETVIRARGPTLEDTSPIIDTTDRSATTERGRTSILTPTKQPSALKSFFRENLLEIVTGSILVPLLIWGASELYSLNREVGELQSGIKSVTENNNDLEQDLGKVESRIIGRLNDLSTDVDRLERRIDDVIDNQEHN